MYTSITEKSKCLDPSELFVFQLIDTIRKSYNGNTITHSTTKRKVFIAVSAEHIHF